MMISLLYQPRYAAMTDPDPHPTVVGSRVTALGLIFAFWALSLWSLDRFPPILDDEPWILSPGYKFFEQGVYGSDLFAGAFGMAEHYLQFMPLMPLIQGAALQLWGVGLFQLRFVPLAIGTLLLALTFAVARRLSGASGGLLALILLLTWQWMPAGGRVLASGIPFVDITRLARYDMLTALLGLTAFWHFLQARTTNQVRYDLVCGLFAGLAGLAHLYGLLWGGALLFTLLLDRLLFSQQPIRRSIAWILLGLLAVWLPWLVLLAAHWDDYVHQQLIYPERFDLWNPSFYLTNLLQEPYRYSRGWRDGSALSVVGFWVLCLGLPVAVVSCAHRLVRRREREMAWLLGLATALPVLFALLIQPKNPYYLPSSVVPFVLLMTRALVPLLQAQRAFVRLATNLLVALLVVQGLVSLVAVQRKAAHTPPAIHYLAQIRQSIPPGSSVLGLPPHWLAVPEPGYRSVNLLLLLAEPAKNPAAVSLDAALEQIAPQFILVDPPIANLFTDFSSPLARTRSEQFWAYMHRHHAVLVDTLYSNTGAAIQIYRLDR
jgi:4-amino-4-deoxy-L-arabinose transferase-like glycosyltransferase